VGVNGRQGGRDAIALARQLAAPDARITLVHVYGDDWMMGRGASLELPLEHHESQELLARERRAAGLDAEILACAYPPAGPRLLELAEKNEGDLLVVGCSHRGPLGRHLIGDQTAGALNGARCAVAIAPTGYASRPRRFSTIGVVCGASSESDSMLAAVSTLAADHGAKIRRVPVGSPRQSAGDEPNAENQAVSEELDLLVVSSGEDGPRDRSPGARAWHHLARRTPCPLLVIAPPEATAP
jgi:nucleotide-binding universal stress UspA family protein